MPPGDPPGSWAASLRPAEPALHPGRYMSDRPVPLPRPGDPLRIAFLIYRGNPHCGGPGRLQPPPDPRADRARPHRDDARGPAVAGRRRRRSTLEKVAGPRPLPRENPFRVPWPHEFRTLDDVAGVRDHVHAPASPSRTRSAGASTRRCATAATSSTSCTTTSASARGLLGFLRDGWPFVNTLHHPITVDRDLDLAAASGAVAAHDAAPLVRLPRHADEGRAPGAAPHHRVGELEEGHRRADGRRHRHAARRAGRRRPGAVPPAPAHRARARAG